MEIEKLALPRDLTESYMSKGITSLYPPQAECVERGLLDRKNLLISIPTASGKTLVAEMAMQAQVAAGGKCLYIVPLRALAAEKYEEFSGKGISVGISTGDFDKKDSYLGKNGIIVATSEKVDSLLRNKTPWINDITLMVLDEIHLIESEHRGATLEMIITKMRYNNPGIQVIGLSATIGNPKKLAGWLDAELVTSSWRPVDLRQGVYFNGNIQFEKEKVPLHSATKHDDLNLCLDTINKGGQCLVFVSSRRNAEAFAKRAAKALSASTPDTKELAERLAGFKNSADEVSLIASCVANGAAFHHAGLRKHEREIIEEGFRKGFIEVIAATPTLAAGLNLPARRVIIRDYMRFSSGLGMVPIPVMEYHQMAGRAGRPHLDPFGEAILIAKDKKRVDELFEFFINAAPEDVKSQCGDESALCTHILSLISTGFVHSRTELESFLEKTFYAYQHPNSRTLKRVIDEVLTFLTAAEMITSEDLEKEESNERISPTNFGTLVSRLYIDPRGAKLISDHLSEGENFTEIGLLHLACCSPDMAKLYIKAGDKAMIKNFLYSRIDELMVEIPYDEEGEEIFLRALKSALLLSDWINEVPDKLIEERYGIGGGDIFNTVESGKWLLYASSRLASLIESEIAANVTELSTRVKYGVKRDLLPLVNIKNIGRVRARRLYNQGMVDKRTLIEAGVSGVARVVGAKIAHQIFAEFGEKNISGFDNFKSEVKAERLEDISGVGKKTSEKLKKAGFNTPSDLLNGNFEKVSEAIGKKKAEKIFAALKTGKDAEEEINAEKKVKRAVKKTGQSSFSDF